MFWSEMKGFKKHAAPTTTTTTKKHAASPWKPKDEAIFYSIHFSSPNEVSYSFVSGYFVVT